MFMTCSTSYCLVTLKDLCMYICMYVCMYKADLLMLFVVRILPTPKGKMWAKGITKMYWEVLKCGAGKDWRRSLGPIM